MRIPNSKDTLEKLLSYYLKSAAFAKLKGKTQKSYEAHLNNVGNTFVGSRRTKLKNFIIEDIKPSHLNNAYEQWLTSGTRTANYRKSSLSAAWNYGMRNDIMDNNPVSRIKTQADSQRTVKWSKDQVKTFLSTGYSDMRWRSITLIVHMAYDWGQRVGDMRTLTWDKLDLSECRLDITQSKRGAANVPDPPCAFSRRRALRLNRPRSPLLQQEMPKKEPLRSSLCLGPARASIDQYEHR